MNKQLQTSILSKRLQFITTLIILFLSIQANGQGAITATWALTSNGNGAAGGAGASTITVGTMTPGTEFSSGNYSSSGYECQSTVTWPTAANQAGGYYLDFPVSPTSGYDLTLSSYSAIIKTSGSSNQSMISFSYALDGGTTFTPFGTALGINSGGTTTVSTTSFTSISCGNGHTMKIRMFIYAGSGGNSSSRNVYVKSLVFNGSTALSVPTPTVTVSPTSQTVCNNASIAQITFSGSPASGTVYNWTNNNTAIGLAASGSGNISFTATNTTTAPITAIITVTPVAGSVSGTAKTDTIIVNPSTTLVNQSYDKNIWVGNNVSFFANAIGLALTYQWQYSTGGAYTNVPASAPYSGTTSNTLSITGATAAMNGYTYQCVVTGTCSAVTTIPNTLHVAITPTITGIACSGSTLTLNSTFNPVEIIWSLNGTAVQTSTNSYSTSGVTVAGTGGSGLGATQLYLPRFTFTDVSGNLYVSDQSNQRILKYAPGSTSGVTIAGTGVAGSSATQLYNPAGICVDGIGNLYVADAANNRIQKFAPGSTTGVTVAGTGTAGSGATELSFPQTAVVDAAGNLYVADQNNNRVQKFAWGSTTGVTVAGTGGNGSGATQLYNPFDLFIDNAGNLFVADASNNRVQKFTPGSTTGVTVAGTGGNGSGATQLNFPVGVFVDGLGNLYVSDQYNNRIQKFAPGSTTGVTVASPSQVTHPAGMFIDAAGNLFVVDQNNNRILEFTNTINNTLVPSAAGTYTAVVIAKDSTATSTASFVVNPTPVVTVSTTSQPVCANGTTQPITFTSTVTNTNYAWTNNNTSISLGATGTTNIGSFTALNATNAPILDTITVVPTANGCTGTAQIATITVNPIPTVTVNPATQTICNNNPVAAITFTPTVTGTTYAWVNNTTSIGLAANGTLPIPTFTALNAGTTAVTATINVTPTANGCIGTTQQAIVIVSPTPAITATPASQPVCNGSASNPIIFTTSVPGTTYNWTNNTSSIGLRATDTTNIAAFTAINNGTTAITATITVTPIANTCSGTPQVATITVNPTPTVAVNPANQTICNNTPAAAITFTPTVTGTTYTWVNNTPAIGLAANGTLPIPTFTAVNSTATADTATITVTPTANGCPGTPVSAQIIVKPTPSVIISPTPQLLCVGFNTQPISFTGPVAGTVYNWVNNNTSINLGASGSTNINAFTTVNTGNTPVTATITVTPLANGCTGANQSTTITVNPAPIITLTPSSQTVCNTAAVIPVNFSSSITNTSYNWTNNNTSTGLAATGTTSIGSFPAVNTGIVPISSVIAVIPTAGGCTGPTQYDTITVNPSPTVTASPSVQPVCNGDMSQQITFTSTIGVTTFLWTNNNTATNLAASGTDTIQPFMGTNTGNSPITSIVTVNPISGSCMGTPYTLTITVNPTPAVIVSQPTQPVCNGMPTLPIGFTGNVANTVFKWYNNQHSIGLADSGITNPIAAFNAINATNSPIISTITVFPVANGCTGLSQTAIITVNPTPNVTATPTKQAICNGTAASAIVFTSNVSNANIAWTNNTTSIGLGASGTGNTYIFTGTNTSNAPVSSLISVTPTANGCSGAVQTDTITVNPIPTVTATPSNQIVCNNIATQAILFTSNVSGASFAWTNGLPSVGIAASGTSSSIPAFTASNSSNVPATAIITVIPTANGCIGNPKLDTILVNPTPFANPISPQILCNGGTVNPIPFSGSLVSGTSYSWTNSAPSIGLAASGTTNINAFTGINTGSTPVVATIAVTPIANGCSGAVKTATITVNPTPNAIVTPASQPICNGAPIGAITITGSVNNTTFSWTNNRTIGLPINGAGNITSVNAINNGTAPILDTISIIPVANGCPGAKVIATITANPTPIVGSTPVSQSVCNATTAAITFNSAVSGTTYTWSNNISTIGLNGIGNNNISFTATNTTPAPVIAFISVTPTANGCTGATQVDTITVRPTPTASITAAANPLFCPTDSVRIIANTGAGLTYQWQFNNSNIPGATVDTFFANPAGNYNAVVTNIYNCPTTSNTVVVTHLPAPAALITPAGSTNLCIGDSVLLNANISQGVTYTWKLNGVFISNAHSISYTARLAGAYTVYESDGTCNATTPVLNVTVNPYPPAVISSGGPAYFCPGSSVTLTADSGITANYTYQYSLNGAVLTGNTQTYTAVLIGNYSVKVTNAAGCSNTSSLFPVSTIPAPSALVTYNGNPAICIGDSIVFNANPGSGYSFQWQQNGTPIPSATAITYTATTAGNYAVKVTALNGCSTTDTSVVVTLTPGPTATATAAGPTTVCEPVNVLLNAATGNNYTYQWQQNGSAITGATAATYTANASGNYSVKVSNGSCAISSLTVPVTVNPLPVDSMVVFAPKVICTGGSVLMRGALNPTYLYQWQLDSNNISGATSAYYSATVGGYYDVKITTAAGCSITTVPVGVATAATPTPVIIATGNQLCALGYTTYQWFLNGVPIQGATGACINPLEGGGYTVAVTNVAGCAAVSPVYDLNTGVSNVVAEQVKLYPNPATQFVNVSAPQKVNVSLSSMDGKQLIYVEDAKTIDISSLPNAIYLLKVYDKNNTMIKIEKLVKTGW
ncbi:MAG: T9SS type A sorting domain-containing protein [Flavipsychrobacter sp.]|nr:T9SS type A sorting domain-containing protein [Flavipsychrobacter sp.]